MVKYGVKKLTVLKLSVSLRCLVNNIYSEILFHPVHCLRVNKSRYENVPLHFLRLQHSTSSVYLLIDYSNLFKTNAVVISMNWFLIDNITFTSNYNTIDDFFPQRFRSDSDSDITKFVLI